MAHSIVREEDYNVINYDRAAKENTNFYRVVYTSKGQTVLSAIPPNGMSSQRQFKNTDTIIDVVEGEGLVTMSGPNSQTQTHKINRDHHIVVDDGESFTIKNILPDRWLKMTIHFTDRVMPEGAVYPTDPYPQQASLSTVAISPVPVRTTIQTVPIQAIPVQPVPVQTFQMVSQPVRVVSSPMPTPTPPNYPLVIQQTPSQSPTNQYFQTYTTTQMQQPTYIPSFPSGSSVNAPALPVEKPLI